MSGATTPDRMKPCVLVAAPPMLIRRLSDALGARSTVMTCSDRERAEVLIATACFQAIVVADGYAAVTAHVDRIPVIRVGGDVDATKVCEEVIAAIAARKVEERREARVHAPLTSLEYDEYIELVRFRETRRYLLGLMQRYRGSVTTAARRAGMARESLHRLLRRHDVDAELFRDDG
jgi:DNA-binding NtrC family response regulator